jgi:hypothetical protein
MERRDAGLSFRVVQLIHEHADAPDALGLLRPRRGPHRCRAAERDELAAFLSNIGLP